MNKPRHILLWLMFLLCFVAMSFAGNRNNYPLKDSMLSSVPGKREIPINKQVKPGPGCNVKLPPDYGECNNGVVHFATDPQYTPVYSDNLPGDTYNWIITGELGATVTYMEGSKSSDRYPAVKLESGFNYKIILQYTTGGITCSATQIIYKRPAVIGTVGGSTPVCIGAVTSYTNNGGDAGGAWSSSLPSVATVDPVTGTVTAVSGGSSNITYSVSGCSSSLSATQTITVNPNVNAGTIVGVSSLCKATTGLYSNSGSKGGNWISASPLIATVDALTGEVTANSVGTSIISYTLSGCGTNLIATQLVTVVPNANPGTIIGAATLCIGTTGLYTTSGDKGGNWSTVISSGITVEPTTGIVTAVSTGSFMLLYTTNSGSCDLSTYNMITVIPNSNAGTVSGTTPLCIGATSTFTASGVKGGSWSSASPNIATVDPVTGLVTAINAGTSVITYIINGCGPNLSATEEVKVLPQANPGTISGATPVCIGITSTYMTNGDAGGVWSSSLPSVATVNASTGEVTAISAGTSTITYTVTGCGTNLSATQPVIVSPVGNAGAVSGATPLCIGVASSYTSDGDVGGAWSSTNPSVATVDPATGVLTAIKAGTITLNYTVNSCTAPGIKTVKISPDAIAGTLSGAALICIGATSTYTTNGEANGKWSSASTSVATIDPVTGKITGLSAGTSLITYTVTGCGTDLTTTRLITVSPNANAGILSGTTPVCIGATSAYSTDGEMGGVWSSTLPLVATVDPASGRITAIGAGSSTITYSINGCANPSANAVVTVSPNANPGTIHGSATLCIGTSGSYSSDGNAGGIWSSASTSVAKVDPATGLITAISAGTSVITYTVSGCGTNLMATKLLTVSPDAKAGTISGTSPVCIGTLTNYTTDGNTGGAWSSASPSTAIVNAVTGIITAVGAGTTTITYTVSGCGTNLISTQPITVSPNAKAGTISGASPICIGTSSPFTTNGDAGGVWTSASPLVAKVDPSSGIVTTIGAGTATITYTANGCSSPSTTKTITVNPNANAGIISGATPLCIGATTPYISNGNTGGTWSSGSPAFATINASGIVTAVSAGTSLISYTVIGCGTNLSTTKQVTVNPNANAGILGGTNPLCINATATYSTTGDPGGSWSSTKSSVATINAVSGLITTISAGTTTIIYTVIGCAAPASIVVTVKPNANAGIISGATPLCINTSASYTTNGDAGGSWSSSSPSVATVNSATGMVTAISAGTADITYTLSGCGTNLSSTKTVIVDPNANAGFVSGANTVCIGATPAYTSNGDGGGVWSSTPLSVATVQSATGLVTAISTGTATITYTLSGCAAPASQVITVSPNANAGIISGVTPVCIGLTTNYTTDGNTGGTWSSASPLVATVDPLTGKVTAISAGTAIISYTVTGCGTNLIATKSITVSPDANPEHVTGATPLCIGASTKYISDGDVGGTWTSIPTSVATVNPATGMVKAKGAGTAIITYTLTGCGTNLSTTASLTVSPNASAGLISGITPLCIGVSSPYTTNGNAGGNWSSNKPLVATVDPVTGSVTAVGAGTATITYSVSIGCAASSVTKSVTVNPDVIAGVLSGPTPLCLGTSGLYTTTGNAGGIWSSASPSIATVDPASGLVTAAAAGTSVITYTLIGCGPDLSATILVTVIPKTNAGALNGLTSLCIGATSQYTSNGDAGGTWISSLPSVATVVAGTGVVKAISAGTTTITYSIPGTSTICAAQNSIVLTVKPDVNAGNLSGVTPVCIGATITYTTDGTTGGIWTSTSTAIATVDPVTGVVTAISAGTSAITYTVTGCGPNLSATKSVVVSPNAHAGTLTGETPVCIGATTGYSSTGDAGGSWSSSSLAVATVVSNTGIVTAVNAGTATIIYTVIGCAAPVSTVLMVKPNANAGTLNGVTPVCIGSTTTYTTDGNTGGVWTSASPLIATVDASTGIITAISEGTSLITYTVNGCGSNLTATKAVTVSPQANAGIITGITPLCKGITTTYKTDGDAGGVWSSASTIVATVGAASGIITAVNPGTTLITYTVPGCGTNLSTTREVVVSANANPGIISGLDLLCKEASTKYATDGDAGGIWTSTSSSVATIDPTTGIITAIAAGNSVITYTVTGCGTNLFATKTVTVGPAASAGIISGVGTLCIGMSSPYITSGDNGGVWSSTSPLVATVVASSGVVTAISAGTTTITYTVSGCVASATKAIIVSSNANAGIISGLTPLCIGVTSTFTTNGNTGGNWTSGSPLIATVEGSTGLVKAIGAGTATITYSISGCAAPVTQVVTVNPQANAGILSGVSPLCIGATSTYTSNGDEGGSWSSASPLIATVDQTTGTITAISAGTSLITYTVNGCGTNLSATISVTVAPNANVGILSGVTPLCIGAITTYSSNGNSGGIWTSASPLIAAVVSNTGEVTAISAGTSVLTYTISGCASPASTVITVKPDAKAGILDGTTPVCIGATSAYTTNGDAGGVWSSSSPLVATVDPLTGIVTAISAGTATITYSINGCGTNLSSTKTVTVVPNANAGLISGITPLCIEATSKFTSNGNAGGEWSSELPLVARVDQATGLVTAISAGTSLITYSVGGCSSPSATKIVTVSPQANAGAIIGPSPLCIGATPTYFSSGDADGTWSSSTSSIATVNGTTGMITAIGAGTSVISYTVSGCTSPVATKVVTVKLNANAGILSGATPLCIGTSSSYSTSGDVGGEWISSSPLVATVDPLSGVVTAVHEGKAMITYTTAIGCGPNATASKEITVSPDANAGILIGETPLCIGTSGLYSTSGDAGGVWSSAWPSIATVNPSTGLVKAIRSGSSDITYTVSGCGTNVSTSKPVVVNPDANAGTISGVTPLCKGTSRQYTTDGDADGVWSSASTSVATVDPQTGMVTATGAGTATITYTVSGCTAPATIVVTVSPEANPGDLSGAAALCIGTSALYTTNGDKGGNWSTFMSSGITVDPVTGKVTAVNTGTFMILYTAKGGQCDLSAYYLITVNPNGNAGTVSGETPLCVGGTSAYTTDGDEGGSWSSTSPSVATVDPSTGIVTAISAGITTITYTASGCFTPSATKELLVNPNANAGILSGVSPLCMGATTTYTSNGDDGGEWSSTSLLVATVDPVTGIVTAISTGTTTINYAVTGCGTDLATTKEFTVSPPANAGIISGETPLCIGVTSTYTSNGDAGGGWSSSTPSIATINPVTGVMTAVSAGTTTITYAVTGCGANLSSTKVVTVSPNATAGIISGVTPLCIGATTTYISNGDAGGGWSSTLPSIATIDPVTGMITAISAGTTSIIYTVTGCGTNLKATKEFIVSSPANAGIVNGATPICIGVSTNYTTNGDTGGVWSSSSPLIATVDPVTGMVTAIGTGTSIITYTISGCGTNLSATKMVTVSPQANAGILGGISPLCMGATTIYTTNGDAGGAWSSTSPSVATIDPVTGVITAISAGITTITYTVSGCAVPAAKVLSVSSNANAGVISGATPVCSNVTTPYTTNGDGGGAWSSSSLLMATVNPISGLVTAISAGTSIITYTVSNVNNCNSSVTKPIVVNGLPVASFNSSLAQICENAALLIDSNSIKLKEDVNTSQYQWYINNSLLGVANYFPGYSINKKDDLVTIKLKAISLFGCISDSISKSINVIHSPKPSFTLSDTIGCGPLAVSFNNTTTGTAYQYHWDFGNGISSNGAQPATITYNYADSGSDTTYTISLTAYSQCDTVTILKHIVVKRKAKVDFSATPTIGCSPIKVLFSNHSIGENAAYKLWFGDGTDTLLTTASISHYYYTGVNAIYNAKLVAVNACGSDSISIPITGTPNTIKPAINFRDSILCGSPNTVTIYNTTTGANHFNWDFGDGITATTSKSPDSISHVYTQKGSYVVKIGISNGCSDTVILRNIYLYSIPAIDFTAIPQSVCMGDSIHFNALTDIGSSFIWRFGDGSGSVLNNPVYSYKNAGIYSVLLKVANANNTCYDSITKPLEVVASRQGYMQASDTVIRCVPFTETFINRSTPSISTQWNFGDGSFAKGDTVTHIFIANGNYLVTLLSVSPGGCKFADTNNIRVASPGGSLVYNTNISCTKGPIKFESITTNADSIRWDFGDGSSQTSSADNSPVYHTYPQAGIYLPKARIIGSTGCSVVKDRGDTIKIEQVVAAYKLAVIYDCGKTTFNFIDSSRSFFGINNWDWNIGPSSFSNQKNITQVYNQAGVYPVVLIVTGNAGCKDTVKSNMQVGIYQYPKVNINGIAAVCKESLINLKSQVISTDSIKSLLWDLGNGSTSMDSSVQILYNSSGSYMVKLTVSTINKCYDSAYKQLTIYAAPAISLNRINTICRGSSVDLLASGALNYIWKDQNDSIICNGCNSINVTPLNNVKYKIIGYNQYGCSKIDSASINVIQPFLMTVSPIDSICIGSEKKLSANGANSYNWYPEYCLNNCISATVYATPLVTTTYRVIGKDINKCFADTSHVTVVVGGPTPLDIGRDTLMQSGSTYTFNPVLPSMDIIKWSWSGLTNSSCNDCPNPQARIVYDGCVSCTVTNSYNCQTSDTLCIKTFCPNAEVFVPNAFTPDGDGINDKLMVQGKGIKLIKSYRIFNRWGEMVFERTNFSPGDPAYAWDGKIRGKLASPDIFVYICEAICEKGYSSIFKGNVAILK